MPKLAKQALGVVVTLVIVAVLAVFIVWGRQDARSDRDHKRTECLDKGGIVRDNEYGRYEGCVYSTVPMSELYSGTLP